MRRVVVTGIGIWSCIGQNVASVLEGLQQGKSGIVSQSERLTFGLQSALVGNVPLPQLTGLVERKYREHMGCEAMMAYMASCEALSMSELDSEYLRKNEVGIIWGADGSISHAIEGYETIKAERNSQLVQPTTIFKSAASSVPMNLSTIFHLRGVNLSVGAACASSSHAIGLGKMYIQQGLQDVILVGGSTELDMRGAVRADAIEAFSLRNNDPQRASRPFDRDRDGMVQSGGAATLVLEEYEHAVAHGATILAEVAGYGFSSNGTGEISQPNAEGEYRAMERALKDAGLKPEEIDYVNAHATSTYLGDIEEAKALTKLFGGKPWISSTKSMTGHENWMAGASEAVYSILMMQHGFVAPNINLENVIDEAKDLRIARETIYTNINTVLSNSSGMGGTNSAIVLKKI